MGNNIDSLNLYVKKEKSNEIIEYYKIFGWEIVDICENKKYEDILDLTFSRPHDIKNKDELQLYQVYLEEELNNYAKQENFKHSKVTIFTSTLGVVAFLLVFGVLGFLNIINLPFIVSCIFSFLGVVAILLIAIFTSKIVNKEKIKIIENLNEHEQKIKSILDKVLSLKGGTQN